MVSVTWRLVTGVTETAGGGGVPWAAATPHGAATLSAQATTFQATELRPGIELLLTVGAMFASGRWRSAPAYTRAKPPSTNSSVTETSRYSCWPCSAMQARYV